MARYLLVRSWGMITQDEMAANGQRSKDVREAGFRDITWEHSHVVAEPNGLIKSYCVYQAPDEARLRDHAAATGGHVVDAIFEIAGDVGPSDFA